MPGAPGGQGGIQTGTLAVAAGETLEVFVGGLGLDGDVADTTGGELGGYNGGGGGGSFDGDGGGGGGASDIRTSPFGLGDRVVAAGGGGGGGGAGSVSGPSNCCVPGGGGGPGGSGAAGSAGGGTPAAVGGDGGDAGGAGPGGAGGSGGVLDGDSGATGGAGDNGSLGQGGSVGTGGGGLNEGGGDGGGGGYYGGGGGGRGGADDTSNYGGSGGGCGGSSYIRPTAVNPTSATGANTGSGSVTISFAVSAPSVTSASAATFPTNLARSFTVTAIGVPTPTLSLSGTLPKGVTFTDKGNGTATITGTAALNATGRYPLTIIAANGVSPSGTQSLALSVPGPPTAKIHFPANGGTYAKGQVVATAFSCADAAEAPGIVSCADSNGRSGSKDTGSGSTGRGALNTSKLGFHTYAVVAASLDGQSTTTSISYAVIATSMAVRIESAKIGRKHNTAAFSFKATGIATGFQCALIKQQHLRYPKPSFASCRSPKVYQHLKPGNYKFEVEAVSSQSRRTPGSKRFTIT